MSNVFFNIEAALQNKLNGIANHPHIQWENDDEYRPVLDTRYWRPTNLPIRGELASTAALQKHLGIYQIDVFVPVNKGLAVLMSDLDLIYSEFNTVELLYHDDTRVDILNLGRGRVARDKSWCNGFIEIYYMCYSH